MKNDIHTPCGRRQHYERPEPDHTAHPLPRDPRSPLPDFPPLPPVPDTLDRKLDAFLERITECTKAMVGLGDTLGTAVASLDTLGSTLDGINEKVVGIETKINDYLNGQ